MHFTTHLLVASLLVTGLSTQAQDPTRPKPHNTERAMLKVLVKHKATARSPITIQRVALAQDEHGRSQRHFIQPGEQVSLEVTYPNARAGEDIIIQALDGGTLPNGKMAMKVPLDNARTAGFVFRSLQDSGIQRVLVRKGRDEKIIDLWVGAALPPREETPVQQP